VKKSHRLAIKSYHQDSIPFIWLWKRVHLSVEIDSFDVWITCFQWDYLGVDNNDGSFCQFYELFSCAAQLMTRIIQAFLAFKKIYIKEEKHITYWDDLYIMKIKLRWCMMVFTNMYKRLRDLLPKAHPKNAKFSCLKVKVLSIYELPIYYLHSIS
jgi:hypothetical protein